MLFFSELDHYDVYISIFFILKTELKKKKRKKRAIFQARKREKKKTQGKIKLGGLKMLHNMAAGNKFCRMN